MSNVVIVNDENFDSEVLSSSLPVLVEFGASWCGPCKRQLPILEKMASDYSEKIKVVKIDIDEAPNTSIKYSIKSVPALFMFNSGDRVDSKVGLTSEADIKSNFLTKVGL